MKDILTPIEMKSIDKNTEGLHVPTLSLMENAGAQIARYVKDNYKSRRHVTIYCGTGGNGGDGLVVARHLLNYNFIVHVILLSKPENIKNKDTKTNWKTTEILSKTERNLKVSKSIDSAQLYPGNTTLIIDAILGTGVNGNIRQPTSKAIDDINQSNTPVISVDIPSGLNPENGEIFDKAVKATTTLTLHKPKSGLIKADEKYVGNMEILDIGIPRIAELYTGVGDLQKIKNPIVTSHKGQNGVILIIGGNPDYVGAVMFAAESALKQGIDQVYIAAPEKVANIIKQYNPAFIVKQLSGEILSLDHYNTIKPLIDKADSILIGSGAGLEEDTSLLYNKIVIDTKKVIVIDADALKLVKKENIKNANVILTPHKKEFELFFDCKLPNDFDKQVDLLNNLANTYNLTINLKGVTDIISCPDDYKLNNVGNQGMTMGGTGDMLAGITVALVAKGNTNFESAYLASYILGSTADKALEEYGFNYTPSNLIKLL